MTATVLPANATDNSVSWSVVNGSGAATINATGMLTASASGNVTVVATANDGSGVTGSQQISIGSASINESDNDFQFSLFPNPAQTVVNFIIPEIESIHMLTIRDISGKLIAKTSNLKFYSTEELESGIYFVTLLSNNNETLATRKFQKN